MKKRKDLSDGEKKYIDNKLFKRKIISFFIPQVGQIWSKRWGLFCRSRFLFVLLYVLTRYALTHSWQSSETIPGRLMIILWCSETIPRPLMIIFWWLMNVVATLVDFTEEAYEQDEYYFQKYLNNYKEYVKKQGYDAYGYDEEGYNREGYDAYGYNREGYNREGYNREGYDKYGFDKNGYNYKGFDKNGNSREGYKN